MRGSEEGSANGERSGKSKRGRKPKGGTGGAGGTESESGIGRKAGVRKNKTSSKINYEALKQVFIAKDAGHESVFFLFHVHVVSR